MKVMTFNILNGGEERFDAILDVVRGQMPDLLVLQECAKWEDGVRLAEIAKTLGVPNVPEHVVLGLANPRPSGARYDVALFSRIPIQAHHTHTDEPIAHCVVEAKTETLNVIGIHLTSHDEDQRIAELAVLERILDGYDRERDKVLVAGDLNALLRDDPYDAADLAASLSAAGIDKYGHPPRFDVMDRLTGRGLLDALRRAPATPAWATAPRTKNGVSIPLRTDYLLVSKPLAADLASSWMVDVGAASDHHAVVAELRLDSM
jgi:exodeoxyribonuclease III